MLPLSRLQQQQPLLLLLLVLSLVPWRGSALSSPSPPPLPSAPPSSAGVLEVDTLVIGGGVSGLTTAYYASKGGSRTLLVDRAPKLGGVIDTKTKADGRGGSLLWEDGPNTFQASATGLRKLAHDLGLGIVASDPALPRYVLSKDGDGNDRLYALPKDLPKLLSFVGLLRAAAGLILRPIASTSNDDDETVASFVSRVFGDEVLEKVVEPFVSTVYTGDPAALSLASVFPFLGELANAADDTPGGLLHCFVQAKRIAAREASAPVDWTRVDAGPRPSKRDYGTLPPVPKGSSLSFAEGLRALPDAALAALGDDQCKLGWTALSVQPSALPGADAPAFDVRFDTPDDERTVRAHTVVVAIPAKAAAELLAPLAPSAAGLAAIRAPPVAAVTLAYPRGAIAPTEAAASADEGGSGGLNAFGLLIPRSAGVGTLGFQFVSSLFPSRAEGGEQVILGYYGGAQSTVDLDGLRDKDIVARVHADAQRVLLSPDTPVPTVEGDDEGGTPRVLSVRRWKEGIPQYGVGHASLVAAVRSELPRTQRGGVLLGGAAAGGGVALGACAESGWACARAALEAGRYRAAARAARAAREQ